MGYIIYFWWEGGGGGGGEKSDRRGLSNQRLFHTPPCKGSLNLRVNAKMFPQKFGTVCIFAKKNILFLNQAKCHYYFFCHIFE